MLRLVGSPRGELDFAKQKTEGARENDKDSICLK